LTDESSNFIVARARLKLIGSDEARMIHGWTLSSVVAFALVAVLSALTALADASLPDPSWISGVYDDNDFDDIVGFSTSGASLVDDVITRDLWPPGILGAKVPQAPETLLAFFGGRSAVRPRAPPAS
jgi:hypothetical protein